MKQKSRKFVRRIIAITLSIAVVNTSMLYATQTVSARDSFDAGEIDTYTENHSFGIVGAMTGWGWGDDSNPDVPMTDPDGDGIYVGICKNLAAGSYEFEVRADNSWDDTWSVYEADYERTMNSQINCSVTVENTTDLIVTLDTNGDDEVVWPVTFMTTERVKEGRYGIVGSFTGWGNYHPDIPMYEYAEGKFVGIVKDVAAGRYEFKVRADNAWDESYSIYEWDYDRTNNSQINCLMNIDADEEKGDLVVFFDTTGDDDCIWPISWTVVTPVSLKEIYAGRPDIINLPCGVGGSNVTYTYDNDGILIISGSGKMKNYSWYQSPFHRNYIKKILIKDGVTSIGNGAFSNCKNLTSITIPNSVISIEGSAFYGCTDLKDVYYSGTKEEWKKINIESKNDWLTNANIHFNSTGEEQEINDNEFIKQHLDFIGSNQNNTYHNMLKNLDLSQKAKEDYGSLQDLNTIWRAIQGEIFENPYDMVLADMIMGEKSAHGQLDSFDANLQSNWISLINDIMDLINSEVDLSPSEENDILEMFKMNDFSDDTTFKLCEKIFKENVSKEQLNAVFNTYDKTNTFLDILDKGQNIVNSVVDTINYSAILKSYEDTSDEFKIVLMQMAYGCQMDNPLLYVSIDKYLNMDYDAEMCKKILKEIAGNGIDIGTALFESVIEERVIAFLMDNMDLSKVGMSVASKVLGFVQGARIGISIGTGIDNILFNTGDTQNSYAIALATAKAVESLKFALENNESEFVKNPTLKNACLFCETFNMYRNIQMDVADKMIAYFADNQVSLINRIFRSWGASYEVAIYQWQVLKIGWQNISCHDESVFNPEVKNITVACPVDVVVYDKNNNIALKIIDDEVIDNNGYVSAVVCNSIKYITLPNDNYDLKITARDNAVISYSVSDYNCFDNTDKTVHFDDIKVDKNKEYIGKIYSDEIVSEDMALKHNQKTVESKISVYGNEDKIDISNIELNITDMSVKVYETNIVSAKIFPENASNKTVTWYSENPEIAAVDEYGKVTGISPGKTKIVCLALSGNMQSECNVTVESWYMFGDTNGDESTDIADALMIARYDAGLIQLDKNQLSMSDVNKDSSVDIADALMIARYDAGLINNLI